MISADAIDDGASRHDCPSVIPSLKRSEIISSSNRALVICLNWVYYLSPLMEMVMVASLSSPAAPKVSDRLGSYHVHGPATAAYWLSPMERSQRVKQGVPAREVVTLADAMGLPRDQFMRVLGLARSTVERKITQRGPLSQAESEKLVGVERLIGQVDAMVRDAVAENSLNPQNIETAIRKGLLPLLFGTLGLDNAKQVVEQVIQITRVGLGQS